MYCENVKNIQYITECHFHGKLVHQYTTYYTSSDDHLFISFVSAVSLIQRYIVDKHFCMFYCNNECFLLQICRQFHFLFFVCVFSDAAATQNSREQLQFSTCEDQNCTTGHFLFTVVVGGWVLEMQCLFILAAKNSPSR